MCKLWKKFAKFCGKSFAKCLAIHLHGNVANILFKMTPIVFHGHWNVNSNDNWINQWILMLQFKCYENSWHLNCNIWIHSIIIWIYISTHTFNSYLNSFVEFIFELLVLCTHWLTIYISNNRLFPVLIIINILCLHQFVLVVSVLF